MIHHRLLYLIASLLLAIASSTLHAQETLVPLDSAGKIERIDAALELRLHLFDEFTGFEEAALYRVNDTSYSLEITYLDNGRRQRQRRELTAAQVADLRRRVSQSLREKAPEATMDQNGRTLLITGTTILGLGYYGPAMIIATGAEDGRAEVAAYMLTAASGFFLPFFVTQGADVDKARAKLSLGGFGYGALHGHLLYGLTGAEDEQATFVSSIVAGLAEGIIGYAVAPGLDLDEGKVDVLLSMSAFGLGVGAGATYLLDGDSWQAYSGGMLLGNIAGGIVGNVMSNAEHYSSGDASVMSTAGVVGAFAPPMLLILAGVDDNESGKIYVSSIMAGAAGGLLLGHHLIADHEFSDAHGNYVVLGTAASTFVALSIAYLAGGDDGDEKLFAAAGLVGSVGGFALMYSLLEDEARSTSMGSSLQFNVSPGAIGALALGRMPAGNASVQLAGLQYRW